MHRARGGIGSVCRKHKALAPTCAETDVFCALTWKTENSAPPPLLQRSLDLISDLMHQKRFRGRTRAS